MTREVVEGIRRHSKPPGEFLTLDAVEGMTLEAQIVRISDAIAYLAHDIGDALRAGVISLDDLPQDALETLGRRHSERVNSLITDIVVNSWACSGEALSNGQEPAIRMSAELGAVTIELRNFMFERVYLPLSDSPEGRAAQNIVELLFTYYCDHPEEIGETLRPRDEPTERLAADMVCGMTDQFALRQAERIRPGIGGELFQGRL